VQQGDFLNEIETEAKPLAATLQAMKRLEDAAPFIRRNTPAFVSHGDAGRAADMHRYAAAPAPVVDRILHKVSDGAFERHAIAEYFDRIFVCLEARFVIGGNGKRRQFGDDVPRDIHEVDQSRLEPIIETLQIEKLFGKRRKPDRILEEALLQRAWRQTVQPRLEDCKGSAPLMGKMGKEALLPFIAFVQPGKRIVDGADER
jgi:hypothetical protein